MHGAAVPERRKTFGCHHAWNGWFDCAERCICERALKRYKEGNRNTQSTNGVDCRRRRIYTKELDKLEVFDDI